jgi:hypothetical protein
VFFIFSFFFLLFIFRFTVSGTDFTCDVCVGTKKEQGRGIGRIFSFHCYGRWRNIVFVSIFSFSCLSCVFVYADEKKRDAKRGVFYDENATMIEGMRSWFVALLWIVRFFLDL